MAAGDGAISQPRKKRAHEDIRVLGNDVLHDDWNEIPRRTSSSLIMLPKRLLEGPVRQTGLGCADSAMKSRTPSTSRSSSSERCRPACAKRSASTHLSRRWSGRSPKRMRKGRRPLCARFETSLRPGLEFRPLLGRVVEQSDLPSKACLRQEAFASGSLLPTAKTSSDAPAMRRPYRSSPMHGTGHLRPLRLQTQETS